MINHFFRVYLGNEQELYRFLAEETERASMDLWRQIDFQQRWRDELMVLLYD